MSVSRYDENLRSLRPLQGYETKLNNGALQNDIVLVLQVPCAKPSVVLATVKTYTVTGVAMSLSATTVTGNDVAFSNTIAGA